MGVEIINRLRGPSKIMVVDATATINLSDLSANTNTENVISAAITSLKWSTTTGGNINITRDAGGGVNVVANLAMSGYWPHDDVNISNTATGNLVITVTGGGTAILEVSKVVQLNVDTQLL